MRRIRGAGGSWILDRTWYEDAEIFARNLYVQGQMSERDYDAYRRLYRAVSSFLPPPDLIVYLRAGVETLLEHIQRRGNAYERNIAPEYLQQLNTLYEAWIGDWTASPIVTIEMDGMDFLQNAADLDRIIEAIKGSLSHQIC